MGEHGSIEEKTLKDILGSFIDSYMERDGSVGFSDWLGNHLQRELPALSREDSRKLADEIIAAIRVYDRTLEAVRAAADGGTSKEEWLAGHLAEAYADMPMNDAGEKIRQIEENLTSSNLQLMQGIGGALTEDDDVVDVDSVEWNAYSVKDRAYGIGQQAVLSGLAVAANVMKERMEKNDSADIGEIVGKTLQDGLIKDPEEAKAVVAGAVKAAVENGAGDMIPADASIDVIGNIAGMAVESAEALYDVAVGESTAVEAMDRIGMAAVAAGGCYASDALKGCLVRVPFIGPVLVDLLGGLLDHMKGPKFTEDVYTVVRNTATATWEGIKKSRVVKSVGRMVDKARNTMKKIFY